MAAKKISKNSNTSTVDILKKKAEGFNKIALKTSHEMVEETIATGEQWQNLLAKSLKKGVALFGRQQDMMFSGLEMLKGQYKYGNKRFLQLLDVKPSTISKKKAAAKKAVKNVGAKVEETIDELMDATIKAEKKTVKKVRNGAAKKTTVAVKKTTAAAKKTTTKKRTVKAKTIAVNPAKLTVIEGIGPKIQEIMNKAGILTFDQLSTTSPADLKEILVNAGTRFQMHDPSTWAAQAKLAAAGKMDELKVLQVELKGGK